MDLKHHQEDPFILDTVVMSIMNNVGRHPKPIHYLGYSISEM
jgi:hypothetical protein